MLTRGKAVHRVTFYVHSGHHMLPVALGCQDAPTLDRLLTETVLLHEDHDRDAGDTLMMAFDRGTFTKVCPSRKLDALIAHAHRQQSKPAKPLGRRLELYMIATRRSSPKGFFHINCMHLQMPSSGRLTINPD